jgi:F420-0:gamma-glutamyl ligase
MEDSTTAGARNFTDEDIVALVRTVISNTEHSCRFDRINPDDLDEAVKFYKNFNKIVTEGTTTARKTLVVITITSAVGIAVAGFFDKIKEAVIK